MHVTLKLDSARLYAWHLVLLDELAHLPDCTVGVALSASPKPLPAAVRLGLALEKRLAPYNVHPALAPLAPDALDRWLETSAPQPDLVIDLATGIATTQTVPPVLTPVFDGHPGETALWAALLQGVSPRLKLHDSNQHQLLDIGWPKTERPLALSRSAAEILARLIPALVRAALEPPPSRGLGRPSGPLSTAPLPNLSLALAHKATKFARRTAWNRTVSEPQWIVAWRRCQGQIGHPEPSIADLTGYHTLPDQGTRYFADPFLFTRGGDIQMFIEEFPYERGRAFISVCTLKPDGTTDAPRPVLQTEHHMSYPQIFARDGEIWMLPECSGSGKLTLYRAKRYPDEWEPAADLIDAPLHDATFFEHAGRLWIAASAQGMKAAPWGSSWDSLSLYRAPALLGPWTAYRADPVLIDARSARPAGDVYALAGKLFRPVQDCSSYYGSSLGVAEITRLDDDAFEQKTIVEVAFPKRSRLLGPHTLSRLAVPGGFIEGIDVYGRISDLRAAGASI